VNHSGCPVTCSGDAVNRSGDPVNQSAYPVNHSGYTLHPVCSLHRPCHAVLCGACPVNRFGCPANCSGCTVNLSSYPENQSGYMPRKPFWLHFAPLASLHSNYTLHPMHPPTVLRSTCSSLTLAASQPANLPRASLLGSPLGSGLGPLTGLTFRPLLYLVASRPSVLVGLGFAPLAHLTLCHAACLPIFWLGLGMGRLTYSTLWLASLQACKDARWA